MTKETSLTDAQIAREEYRTYVETAYKIPGRVADSLWRRDRRKKKQQKNSTRREAGSWEEEDYDETELGRRRR
jgi:hypothetical protein